jgi:uncharacterized membrane protein (GlpM family)
VTERRPSERDHDHDHDRDADSGHEPRLTDPVSERPTFSLARIRQARPRDLVIRFAAGALTSVIAGLLTMIFSPRIGGIMLGFPAILAASLTLIAQEEDARDAREDARGASVGAVALVGFAVLVWLLLGHIAGGLVLVTAVAAWLSLSVGLYVILWRR